jgi:hypothetical protein
VPTSLLPVIERLFDDAGLFPPASHSMADALSGHERARAGPYGSLVGPFLCPAARLQELDACVAGGSPRPPELALVLSAGEPAWRRVTLRPGTVQVEAPLGVALPRDAERLVRYAELPARGDVEVAVEAVARAQARVKVRCGGLTADAVPSSERLAEVLYACARRRLPLKATAGLHHPFRETAATGGREQHGFLNLLAAASAAVAGDSVEDLVALLDLQQGDAERIVLRLDRTSRSLVASIGTCSIDEPVEDLKAAGLLG